MSDIPEEIIHKIEEKVEQMPLLSTQEHLFHIAIFGYHLRDKEVEEIRNAAIRQSNIATDRLNEKDARIKELEEQISYLKVIADDE